MKGILLVQLGTPDSPSPKDVGRYLREFLMDGRVIDIPWMFRFILVNLIIVPFRSRKSAEAYSLIWTSEGSPLKSLSEKFTEGLRKEIAAPIELAMRYQQPSIAEKVKALRSQGVTDLFVVPLYPQFAMASTESSIEAVKEVVSKQAPQMKLKFLTSFYKEPEFIEAVVAPFLRDPHTVDHFLFSFHGIPERQIKKLDPSKSHCLIKKDCCDAPSGNNQNCYRHHCFVTAELIAKRLGLSTDKWSISFQSRLGRTPWLTPFTDIVLEELPAKNLKKIAVFCPSFVTDCLETLEEIRMRGRETFLEAGGKEFIAVPCPNADPSWIRGFAQVLKRFIA